jgi:hypothetical protein
MAALTKVEWLRMIAAKLAGENVCTPNDDTICETLEKILKYLPDGGVNPPTVDVSDKLKVVECNENVTIESTNYKALKCGNVYKLVGTVNVNISMTLFNDQVFAIEGLTGIVNSLSDCLITMSSGAKQISALVVEEGNNVRLFANVSGKAAFTFDFTFVIE